MNLSTTEIINRTFRMLPYKHQVYNERVVSIKCTQLELPYIDNYDVDFNIIKMDKHFPHDTVVFVYLKSYNAFIILKGTEYRDPMQALEYVSEIILNL